MADIDQPQTIRPGEELNLEALEAFLSQQFPDLAGPVRVSQFGRGYSNLTYLVEKGGRQMVLRRPPFGANIKSAHDMGREFKVLSGLIQVYPLVPRPLAYSEDPAILGAPFYLMERIQGLILRDRVPAGLELSPDRMRRLSENFIVNLVKIHQADYARAGLTDLGKPEGYVTRQIEGWAKRYANARTDDLPAMEKTAQWLLDRKRGEVAHGLIHNDYKYDNILLDPAQPEKIIGVLDWEMCTIGDPMMDLGSTLGYWVDGDDPEEWRSQAFGVTHLPGNMRREELAEAYAQQSGWKMDDPVFYYAYGLFKIAVIVQQIYARYKAGLTQDARFGRLIHLTRAAGNLAQRAIEKKKISGL